MFQQAVLAVFVVATQGERPVAFALAKVRKEMDYMLCITTAWYTLEFHSCLWPPSNRPTL